MPTRFGLATRPARHVAPGGVALCRDQAGDVVEGQDLPLVVAGDLELVPPVVAQGAQQARSIVGRGGRGGGPELDPAGW